MAQVRQRLKVHECRVRFARLPPSAWCVRGASARASAVPRRRPQRVPRRRRGRQRPAGRPSKRCLMANGHEPALLSAARKPIAACAGTARAARGGAGRARRGSPARTTAAVRLVIRAQKLARPAVQRRALALCAQRREQREDKHEHGGRSARAARCQTAANTASCASCLCAAQARGGLRNASVGAYSLHTWGSDSQAARTRCEAAR